MAKDTHPEYDDFLDEAAAAAVGSHDILLIHRSSVDGKLHMRVCGLDNSAARWNAVAMIEWAKYEILSHEKPEQ